jgi:hypothetical protein
MGGRAGGGPARAAPWQSAQQPAHRCCCGGGRSVHGAQHRSTCACTPWARQRHGACPHRPPAPCWPSAPICTSTCPHLRRWPHKLQPLTPYIPQPAPPAHDHAPSAPASAATEPQCQRACRQAPLGYRRCLTREPGCPSYPATLPLKTSLYPVPDVLRCPGRHWG